MKLLDKKLLKQLDVAKFPLVIEASQLSYTPISNGQDGYDCSMQGRELRYVYTARMNREAFGRLLVVTFFNIKTQTADFRVFFNKRSFVAERLMPERKWLDSTVNSLLQQYCYLKDMIPANERSAKTIQKFFGSGQSPFNAMSGFQKALRKEQLAARHKVITDAIDERMKSIRSLPSDFKSWANEVVFDSSRYIYYKRANQRLIKGYCTSCKRDVEFHITLKTPQKHVRHNQKGKCPSCRKNIEFRAEGKTSFRVDKNCAVYAQKTKNGFVLRFFEMTKRYSNDPDSAAHYSHPELWMFEKARHFFEDACGERESLGDHYEYGDFKRTGKHRWCKSDRSDYLYTASLYTRNLHHALTGTPWQRSALYELVIALRAGKGSGKRQFPLDLPIQRYLSAYKECPSYEYMVKARLYKLVCENMDSSTNFSRAKLNPDGKTVSEVLGISKAELRQLRRFGEHNKHLRLLQIFHEFSKPMTDEQLRFFLELGAHDSLLEDLLKSTLEITTPQKVINYIERTKARWADEQHSGKTRTILTYWRDYLGNCRTLGYDMANDFNIFPRDLKKRHDEAVLAVKVEENAHHAHAITAMHPAVQGVFGFAREDLGLVAIAPTNLAEIVAEGQVLRHCVHTGLYIKRIVEGKGYIVFVRRADAPNIPYYTAEVENGVIRQCRGEHNCEITDDVKAFKDDWQKNLALTGASSFVGPRVLEATPAAFIKAAA